MTETQLQAELGKLREKLHAGNLTPYEAGQLQAVRDENKSGILMQFTGLKDVNGKGIYEGDILNNPNFEPDYERMIVKWDNNIAGWGLDFYSPYGGEGSTAREQNITDFTSFCNIIGNVYENPELLK